MRKSISKELQEEAQRYADKIPTLEGEGVREYFMITNAFEAGAATSSYVDKRMIAFAEWLSQNYWEWYNHGIYRNRLSGLIEPITVVLLKFKNDVQST